MTDTVPEPDGTPEPVTESRAPRRPKRERSATESLLSVTLGMEAFVIIFGTLAINGLGVLPSWQVFTGGAVLLLLTFIAMRVVRYSWGVWFGHALQVVLLTTGVIEILAAVSAAIFVGFWIFCFVRGRQLDAAKAAYFTAHPDAARPDLSQPTTDTSHDQERS